MSTGTIAIITVVGVVVVWIAYSFVWTAKQTLLGTWVAVLPSGERVEVQFEGEAKVGTYKQLTKNGDKHIREFGHWTRGLGDLHLLIMATDIKDHPRFGVDTQYWLTFMNKNEITIDGPDRKKWRFRRASEIVKIEFDAPTTT